MKMALRGMAAFAAALCLTLALALLLAAFATTGAFAKAAGAGAADAQQARIDAEVTAIAENWQITSGVLEEFTCDAAQTHGDALAAWWNGLFSGESDAALPYFLTDETERAMVAAVMEDEGFSAFVDADMKRAAARDDVAYAVDEAVCRAVLSLRRSVTDLILTLLADRIPLSMVRPVLLTAAGTLTVLGTVLLALLRRYAGAALLACGLGMALLSLPVWGLSIPALLTELNPEAAMLGRGVLGLLGWLWYGAAALTGAAGLVIMRKKEA